MARTYKSSTLQDMYDNFNKMFQTEGNCYESILDSLEKDYEHGQIPTGTSKMLIVGVLKDVATDYFKEKVKLLTEEQYLHGRN